MPCWGLTNVTQIRKRWTAKGGAGHAAVQAAVDAKLQTSRWARSCAAKRFIQHVATQIFNQLAAGGDVSYREVERVLDTKCQGGDTQLAGASERQNGVFLRKGAAFRPARGW
ncbi:hypothetical protein ON010_g12658 [Phytophthora cinnamomi]|nr:hypothetical protein ON010_g12658 [Phytophthora cinnamomi]